MQFEGNNKEIKDFIVRRMIDFPLHHRYPDHTIRFNFDKMSAFKTWKCSNAIVEYVLQDKEFLLSLR